MRVTFRPRLGLQAWFRRTHQMVNMGKSSLVSRGSSLKEPHCRRASPSEKQTFPETLKISTPALDDSHPGPLRETCGAFQKHANTGGKLKPRWPLAEMTSAVTFLIEPKGHLKQHPFGYQQPHQKHPSCLPPGVLGPSSSLEVSQCWVVIHLRRLNPNVSRIPLPDGYR